MSDNAPYHLVLPQWRHPKYLFTGGFQIIVGERKRLKQRIGFNGLYFESLYSSLWTVWIIIGCIIALFSGYFSDLLIGSVLWFAGVCALKTTAKWMPGLRAYLKELDLVWCVLGSTFSLFLLIHFSGRLTTCLLLAFGIIIAPIMITLAHAAVRRRRVKDKISAIRVAVDSTGAIGRPNYTPFTWLYHTLKKKKPRIPTNVE